jgi:hypothetical protein
MKINGFPDGYFRIRNKTSGLGLIVNSDMASVMLKGPGDIWYADGLGRLVHINSCLSIHILNSNSENGAKVVLAEQGGGDNNCWYHDGKGSIRSRLNDRAITVDNDSTERSESSIFMWDNYRGKNQLWFFEKVNWHQHVTLASSYAGSEGTRRVDMRLNPYSEVTYAFWMMLDNLSLGNWKLIFTKSPDGAHAQPRSPGLWIRPDATILHPRTTTSADINEGCQQPIPFSIKRWMHVAMVLRGNVMELWIDGQQKTRCQLRGHFSSNNHPIYIGTSATELHLASLEYWNWGLGAEGISRHMLRTTPLLTVIQAPGAKASLAPMTDSSSTAVIADVDTIPVRQYTSNGTRGDCSPGRAALNSDGIWCAEHAVSSIWLQSDFPKMYRVREILTQGRKEEDEWVTDFLVHYRNVKTGQWDIYPPMLRGNVDRQTIVRVPVDFITDSVRVLPQRWKNWPSMSVGFVGQLYDADVCVKYKSLAYTSDTEKQRQKYQDLYDKKCRKISYYDHRVQLQAQKQGYDDFLRGINKPKAPVPSFDTSKVKEQIDMATGQIQRLMNSLGNQYMQRGGNGEKHPDLCGLIDRVRSDAIAGRSGPGPTGAIIRLRGPHETDMASPELQQLMSSYVKGESNPSMAASTPSSNAASMASSNAASMASSNAASMAAASATQAPELKNYIHRLQARALLLREINRMSDVKNHPDYQRILKRHDDLSKVTIHPDYVSRDVVNSLQQELNRMRKEIDVLKTQLIPHNQV